MKLKQMLLMLKVLFTQDSEVKDIGWSRQQCAHKSWTAYIHLITMVQVLNGVIDKNDTQVQLITMILKSVTRDMLHLQETGIYTMFERPGTFVFCLREMTTRSYEGNRTDWSKGVNPVAVGGPFGTCE